MRWGRVNNLNRTQPKTGAYANWKPEIARACGHRCVYCGIHESRYGGIDNFHVEHYRPKSRFDALTNVIVNLYLACAICNRYKGKDWPRDPSPDHSCAAYPDPGEYAYCDLFECNATHLVLGKHVATQYVTERLGLNRPQLILDRRTDAAMERWEALERELASLQEMQSACDAELAALLGRLIQSQRRAACALRLLFESRPYEPGDQQKRA